MVTHTSTVICSLSRLLPVDPQDVAEVAMKRVLLWNIEALVHGITLYRDNCYFFFGQMLKLLVSPDAFASLPAPEAAMVRRRGRSHPAMCRWSVSCSNCDSFLLKEQEKWSNWRKEFSSYSIP